MTRSRKKWAFSSTIECEKHLRLRYGLGVRGAIKRAALHLSVGRPLVGPHPGLFVSGLGPRLCGDLGWKGAIPWPGVQGRPPASWGKGARPPGRRGLGQLAGGLFLSLRGQRITSGEGDRCAFRGPPAPRVEGTPVGKRRPTPGRRGLGRPLGWGPPPSPGQAGRGGDPGGIIPRPQNPFQTTFECPK